MANKQSKSEQEVLRRIAESPRGTYTFERASEGVRLCNAVRKLESAGVLEVERMPVSGYERRGQGRTAYSVMRYGTALICRMKADAR